MDIKDIVEDFKKNTEIMTQAEHELYKDKQNLMFWLVKHKYWKEFFVKVVAESNGSKYDYTREEVLEILDNLGPSSLDLRSSDGTKCCIIVKSRVNGKDLESGYFPIEYFEKIDEIGKSAVLPEDIKERLDRKTARLQHYREQIADYERRIEDEEKEIANLKTWLG
jgi:isopentenyl diphosphate isomerase/L-lactate dehydrogenase-like FMN-dependent dehydrogenase